MSHINKNIETHQNFSVVISYNRPCLLTCKKCTVAPCCLTKKRYSCTVHCSHFKATAGVAISAFHPSDKPVMHLNLTIKDLTHIFLILKKKLNKMKEFCPSVEKHFQTQNLKKAGDQISSVQSRGSIYSPLYYTTLYFSYVHQEGKKRKERQNETKETQKKS